MKLFILAGEPSGDRIGADLVERLRARDPKLTVAGVGGAELAGQGLHSMFPMSELSVMGWRDILPRLPWLHFRAWQVARAIVRERPDVAVLVDAQIFSAVVAGHVRRMGAETPILLYVAPAVWAWAPARGSSLKVPALALAFLFAGFTALCVGLVRVFTRRGFTTPGSLGRTLELPVLAVAPMKAR